MRGPIAAADALHIVMTGPIINAPRISEVQDRRKWGHFLDFYVELFGGLQGWVRFLLETCVQLLVQDRGIGHEFVGLVVDSLLGSVDWMVCQHYLVVFTSRSLLLIRVFIDELWTLHYFYLWEGVALLNWITAVSFYIHLVTFTVYWIRRCRYF